MFMMTGLYYPKTTAIWGAIYLVGRILFTVGYIKSGPTGRMIGAPMVMLTQMFFPIFSMVAMFQFAGSLAPAAVVPAEAVQASMTADLRM